MARLEGHRPLVTRAAEDAADWADSLAAEGALPIVLPCIATETLDTPRLSDTLDAAIRRADWLVFTSRRGVDAVASLLPHGLPEGIRLAAVGQATAARIEQAFAGRGRTGRPDLDPAIVVGTSTGAVLGRELAARGDLSGSHCVLALAENAGDALEVLLGEAGAEVERFDVYRTVPAAPRATKRRLSAIGCTTVIFASPSAVTGFDNQVNVDKGLQIVTIGPSTSAAVRAHNWTVAAEAREPSLSGIIESMLEAADAPEYRV